MLDEDRSDLGYAVGDVIDDDLMDWMTTAHMRLLEYGDITTDHIKLKLLYEEAQYRMRRIKHKDMMDKRKLKEDIKKKEKDLCIAKDSKYIEMVGKYSIVDICRMLPTHLKEYTDSNIDDSELFEVLISNNMKSPFRDIYVYALRMKDELTFREIGELIGVTPGKARQIYLDMSRRIKHPKVMRKLYIY